jgi:hypothetical protein
MVNSRHDARLVSLAAVSALGVAFTFGSTPARGQEAAVKMQHPVAATFAFQLAEIPKSAQLEMLVTGIKSACPKADQPQGSAELLVNGSRVKSFSLGPTGVGASHRITADLPPAILKKDNSVEVKGVRCEAGNFEEIKIGEIVVRSGK